MASTTETFKSEIAEHEAATNHVTGWEGAKLVDQEKDKTRGKNSMNKDKLEGA